MQWTRKFDYFCDALEKDSLSASTESSKIIFEEAFGLVADSDGKIRFEDTSGNEKVIDLNLLKDKGKREEVFNNFKAYKNAIKLEKSKHDHKMYETNVAIEEKEKKLRDKEEALNENKKREDEAKKVVDNSMFGKGGGN